MVTTFAVAILLLSIVVVTGYAGQLSLGQFALAGFGAWVAGPAGRRRRAGRSCRPCWSARSPPCRSARSFAIPAVRARGLNLAIVTLGLGTTLELMVFNNPDLVGGFGGTVVGKPTLVRLGDPGDPVPVPLRHRVPRLLRDARPDGGAVCAAAAAAGACSRCGPTSVPPPRSGSACRRQGLRVRAVGGDRRRRRHAAGVPQGHDPLRPGVHELRVDHGGRMGVHRRDRLPLRARRRRHARAGIARGADLDSIFSGLDRYIQLIGGAIVILLVLQNQDGVAKESAAQLQWLGSKLAGSAATPPASARRLR